MTTTRWPRLLLASVIALLSLLPVSSALAAGDEAAGGHFDTFPVEIPPTEFEAGAVCDFKVVFQETGFVKVDRAFEQAIFNVRQTFSNPATGKAITFLQAGMQKIVTVVNADGSVTQITTSTGVGMNGLTAIAPGAGLVAADVGRTIVSVTYPLDGPPVTTVIFEKGQHTAGSFPALSSFLQ